MVKRKKYSEEFKREAVGLIRQPHANVSQISRDIGVSANLLWRWQREADSSGSKAFPDSALAAARTYRKLGLEECSR